MRKQVRLEEPITLRDGVVKWTETWIANQQSGKKWRWPVQGGQPINKAILETLREQSAKHCSFCDGYPVAGLSVETIEHFHPKSTFPEKALEWENLFYCCTRCQAAKKERFDAALLKPDETSYEFHRFFAFDFTTGEIGPSKVAGLDDQQRAQITIDLYKLNDSPLPDERRKWLLIERSSTNALTTDDFPYRDFLG